MEHVYDQSCCADCKYYFQSTSTCNWMPPPILCKALFGVDSHYEIKEAPYTHPAWSCAAFVAH